MEKIMVVGNNPAFLIDEEKETVEELDTVSSNIDWVYISPVDTVVEYMHKGKLIMVPVKKGQIIIQFYKYKVYGEDYSQIAVLDKENATWINNINIVNSERDKCDNGECDCKSNNVTCISDSADGDDFRSDFESKIVNMLTKEDVETNDTSKSSIMAEPDETTQTPSVEAESNEYYDDTKEPVYAIDKVVNA